jgi:hypothetical protein
MIGSPLGFPAAPFPCGVSAAELDATALVAVSFVDCGLIWRGLLISPVSPYTPGAMCALKGWG